MKKFYLLIMAFVMVNFWVSAQQMPIVPLDPQVKQGVLSNGLTYYIRHNKWPEHRVDFYIAQKVGSMQELDSQRGLAHFLEHMCFNGTTHFPGDGVKQYLERIGVKFGENLNAYTAFDETVYNINNVNVAIPGAIDSCLLILHDWSHDLLLQSSEIDKERGVIHEEWRVRRSPMLRMQERAFETLFQGSRYAQRMPIGTMEVVMNFPHDEIRNYYKRWYRPDLQGIVIVGDVDVNEVEQKIKQVFADIPAPAADAPKREYYPVQPNQEPLVVIEKDREQPASYAMMMFKMPAMPRQMCATQQFYVYEFVWNAISTMLNLRLQELAMQANPAFIQAAVSQGDYLVAKTLDALSATVVLKDGAYVEGLTTVYRELLRASKFGFTQAEYDRFCQEYLSGLEAAYAAREKVENTHYADAYVRHFLDGVPAPGVEWEHQTMKEMIPQIPLQAINQTIAQLPTEGRAVAYFMPEKEGLQYPTPQQVVQALQAVDAEPMQGYVDEVSHEPLVQLADSSASVVCSKSGVYGSRTLTLSNGVRVHLLRTTHEPNQVNFYATSWGGTSHYPNSEYMLARSLPLVGLGGWGQFSAMQLSKRLSGVQASVSPFITDRTEGLQGACVTKDVETLLQLAYLCFTSSRRDDEAFQGYLKRLRASLANSDLNPKSALADSVARVLYADNVRALRMREKDVDQLDYARLLQVYKERFANAADFEFYLIGDFAPEQVEPLIAKYLGALPAAKAREKVRPIDHRMVDGAHTCIFDKEQDVPNALVYFFYHAPVSYKQKNSVVLSMLEQSLDMLYTETVREDEGGAYGVPVGVSLSEYPQPRATLQIQLATSPQKMERMIALVRQGVERVASEGCTQEQLQKIKEYMLRSHAERLKQNSYWLTALVEHTRLKRDLVKHYEDIVRDVRVQDVQAMAKRILKSGNITIVGMKTPAQ